MYLLFFLIWVNLNGKFTVEITVLGLIIAAVIYAFICKCMDFRFQKDIFICKLIFKDLILEGFVI